MGSSLSEGPFCGFFLIRVPYYVGDLSTPRKPYNSRTGTLTLETTVRKFHLGAVRALDRLGLRPRHFGRALGFEEMRVSGASSSNAGFQGFGLLGRGSRNDNRVLNK